jgi:hypothetical protein
MSPDQVTKEFHEPGHIPQGLSPSPYHKLDEVISKESQEKIKARKKKRKSLEKARDVRNSIPYNTHPSPSPGPLETEIMASQRPQSVDLRKYDSYIRSQWDGTCTAHGLISVMENLYNRKGPTVLSTRYFWSLYKKYSCDVAIQTALLRPQIEESLWPQDSERPLMEKSKLANHAKYHLVSQQYLDDDTGKVLDALVEGYPVYVAMRVPQDLSACRSTVRPTTGVTSGGHAMAVVGYSLDESIAGGGYLILKNSWGADCGDNGYQYFPLSLCKKDLMYCMFWAVKAVE